MTNDSYSQMLKMLKRAKGTNVLALPQIAARVLDLSRDPEAGPREFSAVIAADIGLTTQILRFVNSSYFGFRQKIKTLRAALSLVFGRTIKNFILWNAVFALLPNPKCGPFELTTLSQDSLRRGLFAREIGMHYSGTDAEALFLAALFQDVALPILAESMPGKYELLLKRREQTGRRLSKIEMETFGWTHAEASAVLLQEWGFDDSLATLVESHSEADFDVNPQTDKKEVLEKTVIILSGLLPSVADADWKEGDQFFNMYFRFHRKGVPYPDAVFSRIEEALHELSGISYINNQSARNFKMFHQQWLETFE
ncbi:MAG: HDOD domain-containing protein [Planctomycetaceae bacterium]|jgi:HD-like signal output (HDOD) protein|nr:HDOD domain-containing protein [Planctomycetaceae bacterium]